jgi:hypothetical protein
VIRRLGLPTDTPEGAGDDKPGISRPAPW